CCWSSDVCSADLTRSGTVGGRATSPRLAALRVAGSSGLVGAGADAPVRSLSDCLEGRDGVVGIAALESRIDDGPPVTGADDAALGRAAESGTARGGGGWGARASPPPSSQTLVPVPPLGL